MMNDRADQTGAPVRDVVAAAAAIVALCLLGWFTYTREGWVPFLSGVDFGIHELGHLLFMWAPRPLMVLAGSALQVAVPVLLAAYFWFGRGERVAAALLLGWGGSSLNNVSVYIFDATRLALPIWGDLDGTGANHDWRYLLGPHVLDALDSTDAIAYGVRGASGLLLLVALGVAGSVLLADGRERGRAKRLEVHRQTLEVREPRFRAETAAETPAEGRTGMAPGADPAVDSQER